MAEDLILWPDSTNVGDWGWSSESMTIQTSGIQTEAPGLQREQEIRKAIDQFLSPTKVPSRPKRATPSAGP